MPKKKAPEPPPVAPPPIRRKYAPSRFEAPQDDIDKSRNAIISAHLRGVLTRPETVTVMQALGLDNPTIKPSYNVSTRYQMSQFSDT